MIRLCTECHTLHTDALDEQYLYQNFGEDRAIHGGDESAATAQSLSRLRLNPTGDVL